MKPIIKLNKEQIENEKTNKRINLFLTKEDYNKLVELKYKYRLGIGYLVRIITKQVDCYPKLKKYILETDNLYNTKKGMKKTSVKIPYHEEDNKTSFYNNAVVMYLEKLHKQILDEKMYNKFNNQVIAIMQNTTDPLWFYNEHYRMTYLAKKFEKQLND